MKTQKINWRRVYELWFYQHSELRSNKLRLKLNSLSDFTEMTPFGEWDYCIIRTFDGELTLSYQHYIVMTTVGIERPPKSFISGDVMRLN